MKIKHFLVAALSLSTTLLMSCSGNDGHNHDHHGHDHSHHDHAGHNHDHSGHNHDHSGHDHSSHAGHDHGSHDGHNHITPKNAGDHGDGVIVFTKDQAKKAGVVVKKIEAGEFNDVIKTAGQVLSAQGDERTVAATASGIVGYVNKSLTDGSSVNAGQGLFTISSKGIVDGDASAAARVAYDAAKKAYDRAASLVKDKIISQREYDEAKANLDRAKADLNTVSGRAATTGVTVTSPISGYLISLLVKPGEYVSVGQPIATVSQNRRLQLRAEVSERYFDRLSNITSANFILPYRPDETLSLSELNGRVVSFGKASAAGSYYLPVIFEFDNTGNVIPGSYAEIYLLGAPRKGVISVPKGAIAEEQGLYFVFVETSAEHFEKREVKLGANNGTSVEVKSGLKSGEKVVVAGAIHVKMAGLSSAIPHGHSH